jgi:streptogramin lyase
LYYNYNENDIETDALYSIVEASKGKLLIGLYNKGLLEYNRDLDKFIPSKICGSNKNVIKKVMGIVKDDYDNLWLATDGKGLIRVNRKNGYCEKYINEENNLNSISFDEILTIYKDREGSIWLGTDQGGISKFNLKEKKFNIINKIRYKNKSIDIRGVWAIYKNKSSPLWIGTDSNGLIKLDEKNGHFFVFKQGGINSISHNQILSINKENNGGLWIGTDGGGLNRYIPDKSRFVVYENTKKSYSISDNYIVTVFEDENNVTWTGSYAGGLSRLDGNSTKFKNYLHNNQIQNSIAGNFVVSIEKNDADSLWIGTYGFGLDLFDKNTETFKHYKYSLEDTNSLSSNTILYLFMENNILWIGTRGGGLNKFNPKTQKFKYYMEKDGLVNNTVTGIVSDNKGFLWISTKGGISKFNPENETFRNYDKRDGIQSREFNFGSCFKDSKGIIYFGGINGLNFFDPDKVKDNIFVTKCKITKILKNNKSVNVNKSYIKGIKVKKDEFPLYIEFSSLSYISPFKNRYAYRINGLDKSWHYVDSKGRFVLYNNLPYGNYTFCFKGCNNDGVWQKEASIVKLSVIPPYWHTLPFEIFLLFIFSIVSYIIIEFVKRHIKLINFWKKKKYINNFELLDEIGSGGMGTIYKASNMINKKEIVAIKVLKNELFNDEKNRKRFKQEAIIIDQLDHPNIVKIIERGISGDNLYMVMELLEGKTLSEIIIENNNILLDDIIHIISQILDAIEKVHKKNIIHRDIKPDNVMIIKKDGDDKFVK